MQQQHASKEVNAIAKIAAQLAAESNEREQVRETKMMHPLPVRLLVRLSLLKGEGGNQTLLLILVHILVRLNLLKRMRQLLMRLSGL